MNFRNSIFQNLSAQAWAKLSVCTLALGIFACNNQQENEVPKASSNKGAKIAAIPSEWSAYYQGYSDGATYTQSNATSDMKELYFWDSNPTLSIKTWDNSSNQYKALRAKFTAGAYNGGSGVTAETKLQDKNEYTMEYKVYFEPGFEFSKGNDGTIYGGGKLPGLAGGSRPGGCSAKTDGMSARVMFRRDPTQTGPYLELYHYWRGQTTSCGESYYLQGVTTGQWYTIKIRVNLGTTSSNGYTKVWVNGVEKKNISKRYLGSGQSWKLNGTMFHMFMGGNASSWAPNSDRYLMLDNVKVDDNQF
ncbi:MAG: polysaccharide lyase [Leadbetterella sp.]